MKKSYSTKLASIEIEIDGKVFHLKEMTGEGRGSYQQAMRSRMETVGEGKKMKMKIVDLEGMEAQLLSFCLFDPSGKPVSQETINSWPSKMVGELYKEANTINGLQEEEKNDQEGSAESGSD